MSEFSHDESIRATLRNVRRRWLNVAAVNAGGRWAVLPALIGASLAAGLTLTGFGGLAGLMALSVVSLASVAVCLLLVRRAYARPRASGAPDWTLILDRGLGLGDAVPTLLEARAPFREALSARVAEGLRRADPRRVLPAPQWGPLLGALFLALLPLFFWRPADAASLSQAAQINDEASSGSVPGGANNGQAGPGNETGNAGDNGPGGNGDAATDQHASDNGRGEAQPHGERPEDGAGEQPDNREPDSPGINPDHEETAPGDDRGEPEPPAKPNEKEFGEDAHRIRPDVGDGETTDVERSRWVYNPDGERRESTARPPGIEHPGEHAAPRTKLTSRERRLLEEVYRKLYE